MIKILKNKLFYIILIPLIITVLWLIIPLNLFDDKWSDILYDKDNNLLAAHIAKDGQWRLPFDSDDSIPDKYKTCLLLFEDKRFEKHNGVDWLAIGRAIYQNIKHSEIISGGSTISMQVIRLSRKSKDRTIKEKIIEIFLAYKLDLRNSKEDILELYSTHAPFGGNIVGIKAASWRYFGRDIYNLTWAESALLAVLPNEPASVHVNKNRKRLKEKRNRLLKRLFQKNEIDESTYKLAVEEEIPEKLKPFPLKSIHLLNKLKKKYPSKHIFRTYIKENFQKRTYGILNRYFKKFVKNDINNCAAIIAETGSGNVLAYAGNTGLLSNKGENSFVDMGSARRSTGSILKPFLYSNMLSKGKITPYTLIPDYPVHFGSYSPQNFNLRHSGAVKASKCIARSLNVPAVHMLKEHGIPVFINDLKNLGLTTIDRSADNYGLSLILGGAEARLDELTAAYASMGRILKNFYIYNGKYSASDIKELNYIKTGKSAPSHNYHPKKQGPGAGGIWHCFEAMKNVKRPDGKGNWKYFNSEQAIAWKTGTSYGFRDAWSVGITPDYVVGVWVGNADGEGRSGLIGIKTAAPVLFEIFDMLPSYDKWFYKPYDAMKKLPVCKESGYLAGNNCKHIDSIWLPKASYHTKQCPYHKNINVDISEKYRVAASCYDQDKMQSKNIFVLPPAMEYYYKKRHPEYRGMPEWKEGCNKSHNGSEIQIIYPQHNEKIYLPDDFGGEKQKLVFKAAHQNNNAIIYWHINEKYIGMTEESHQIAYVPGTGKHILTLTDNRGNNKKIVFEITNQRD